ncbi:stress up-regulated Nod 19 protein [Trifolium repens]|nr:stress up-regulated Nod 19 protein [Trifolium repens]
MGIVSQEWKLSMAILVLVLSTSTPFSLAASRKTTKNVKTNVFLSPKIELSPGLVSNKIYYDVEFPRGHISLKSFNAELVDELGNSIPLYETYLHHWVVIRYHQPKNVTQNSQEGITFLRNNGFCQDDTLIQYYGLGSETRSTKTYIPDPYGIEVGNPSEISKGYVEKWLIVVHAIDTRGVEDRLGCNECKCELYNITKDENGKNLSSNYKGGLQCCPDGSKCKLKKGFSGPTQSIYLKYTVKWINWNSNYMVPAKIYIFDVTDTVKISNKSKAISLKHDCKVEYEVEPCSKSNLNSSGCVDVKRTSFPMQSGGYVIYGVGHQHAGAIGSTLYGQCLIRTFWIYTTHWFSHFLSLHEINNRIFHFQKPLESLSMDTQKSQPDQKPSSCRKKKNEEATFIEDLKDHIDEFIHASMDEHKACFQKTMNKMFGLSKAVAEKNSSEVANGVESSLPLQTTLHD